MSGETAIVGLLQGEAATARLGAALAAALDAGDSVCLVGPLGAGKSSLARALIAARLAMAGAPPEDAPSPTYTLVQIYEPPGAPPIAHADLYRLAAPEEALELGLEDWLAEGVALIEWPERLGPFQPDRRLEIRLDIEEGGASRRIEAEAVGLGWDRATAALRRALEADADMRPQDGGETHG